MPLYEYHCDSCGHRFEAIQKFSDAPLEKCPKCGAPVRKLQAAPAFQFKGSGWYVTDYAKRDGSSPTAGRSEEKPGEKSAEKSGAAADPGGDSKKEGGSPAGGASTGSGGAGTGGAPDSKTKSST